MKNRKFLLPILLICSVFLLASCRGGGLAGKVPGSGNIQTETRETGSFTTVSIQYAGAEVAIRQGDQDSVEIQADDNVLAQIATQVSGGKLLIGDLAADWETRVNPSQPVKIRITVKDLKEIDLPAAVCTLELNGLQTGTLKLDVSGGAQVRLNDLQVDMLESTFSGAGDIQVSGTAQELKLVHSGFGSFNAGELQSDKATVELSGMGDATVRVEKELHATISGAGSVKYYGNPSIEQDVSGAGSIKPAG